MLKPQMEQHTLVLNKALLYHHVP